MVEVVVRRGVIAGPRGTAQAFAPRGDSAVDVGSAGARSIGRIVKLQIERSVLRGQHGIDSGIPRHDTAFSDGTLTILVQADEFDLGDDGLRLGAVQMAVAELDTGERVLHRNRHTAGERRVMLLLGHGFLTEKDISLLQAVQRGGQFKRVLTVSDTATRRRHAQEEIDLLRLILRPEIAVVVVIITPSGIIPLRFVHHAEDRIAELFGVYAHGREYIG